MSDLLLMWAGLGSGSAPVAECDLLLLLALGDILTACLLTECDLETYLIFGGE